MFPHTGEVFVYDMDAGQRLVQHICGLPDTDGVRGVMVSPPTHILYISHGGDGGQHGTGSLLAYDLLSGALLWDRHYGFGIDSGAISPDGQTIYMPTGELNTGGAWELLNAASGEVTGSIGGGTGPHNTVVSLDGRHVYLGGRSSDYLVVASTATGQVERAIGPLIGTVRPFTINGSNTLAFTTATDFLGFQVSSIASGRVLFTDSVPGFAIPAGFSLTTPSHGITLTPDERQLYVLDTANGYVHLFDVSRLPSGPPSLLASIRLSNIAGKEEVCAYDCERYGWLQSSLDGRFVYVGDSGDVIDTATRTIVANLPPLAQTRQMLEVDWAKGLPVATSTRAGLGYQPRPPGEGPPAPAGAPAVPVIKGLTISPPSFLAANHGAAIAVRRPPRGARVSYSDSAPSVTRFTVEQAQAGIHRGRSCVKLPRRPHPRPRGLGCRRYVTVGTFVRHDRLGANNFRFSGRIRSRKLTPGAYRLVARPTYRGSQGPAQAVSFRILR